MKYSLLVVGIFIFINLGYCQTKWLSMDDAILKFKTTLAPKNLKQINWIPNSSKFYFFSDDNRMVIKDSKLSTSTDFNFFKNVNASLIKKNIDTLKDIPVVTFINENVFRFETKFKQIAFYSIKESSIEVKNAINNTLENADYSDGCEYIAFTDKNNLRILTALKNQITFGPGEQWTASGTVFNVTNESNDNILNGSSKVHRNEFGITKGTFWSPKNSMIAFYRMDQTMVNDYPIIDWNEMPAKNTNIKYPMSGGKSHEVTLSIYNLNSKKTISIQTGKPAEQYLTNIAWSPDQQHIYIAIVNREQNHLWLNSYSTTTGLFEKTLLEEMDEKYIEPQNAMLFVKTNSNQFIWQSNRDGYNHIYLYDLNGKLLKQLTKGKFEVLKVLGFNNNGDKLFYTANAESPINKDLYSVSLSSSKSVKLSEGNGTHSIKLSDDGKYFIDNFSSTTIPNNVLLCDASNGKILQTLLIAENPLQNYRLGEMSIFKIKNDNNDDLFCRLYKPVDFDSTKKYPAIVYLYNGPHVQVINNSWLGGAANLWFQYMAEHGYVVFSIDGRGSDNRGKAFEQAIHRQIGTPEMEDQLEGVDYLKSKSWIDATRLGVHGWSYGGFMTTSLMTRNPDVFKVAVAGGPVIDWSLYEIMYTERYMDSPSENPEGYKENNLLNHIDKLKGKLMLIHGTDDDVVVWQHSIDYIKKCIDKGKQVDYFVYPGHLHNVLGKDRAHLFQKITDYFMEKL
jgi:dipeptidyl-peptidase-4